MAETKNVVEIKTVKVEMLKFHPLIVHEPGEIAEVREETAVEWVEKKFAKLVK